jgi:hypothetical protein
MENTTWYMSNLLAIMHIMTYVNKNDQLAIQDMIISRDVWTKLMTKYEAMNKKRKMAMLKKLFNWKMDPLVKIVTTLKEVEHLYREVQDMTDREIQLNELAIMTIFLGGLPKEYAVWVDAIESTGKKNWDMILMRLQEKELDLLAEKGNDTITRVTRESANRA